MHSPPSSPPGPARRRHKGSRRNSTLARARRLWQDWWVELLVALLILLAIFLLVEQMDIRATLYAWLAAAVDGLGNLIDAAGRGLARFVRNTTLSDLLAYVLIVMVITLAAWRTRYRILTNPRLAEIRCPRCGGEVHRIHRRWYHRALSLIFPLRRYGCKDRACGWQGLCIKKVHE